VASVLAYVLVISLSLLIGLDGTLTADDSYKQPGVQRLLDQAAAGSRPLQTWTADVSLPIINRPCGRPQMAVRCRAALPFRVLLIRTESGKGRRGD
jgi:hypothetical protein